jgi:hypothetical protein
LTIKVIMKLINISKSAPGALALTLLFMLAGATSGCQGGKASDGGPAVVTAANIDDEQRHAAPVLFAVFDDKSGSSKSARITPLREADLQMLIDRVKLSGGEVAFGLIGDPSDRPLLRLRVPAPPTRPSKPDVQNAFERAEQEALLQERLDKYAADLNRWRGDVDSRVNSFMDAAHGRLQEPMSGKTSPVYLALGRAELFLNEPAAVWGEQPRRFIILNSDAVDTTKAKPVTIKSGATLVLVNGSGSLGVLATQHPLQFESVQSALDYIAAAEKGGGR